MHLRRLKGNHSCRKKNNMINIFPDFQKQIKLTTKLFSVNETTTFIL